MSSQFEVFPILWGAAIGAAISLLMVTIIKGVEFAVRRRQATRNMDAFRNRIRCHILEVGHFVRTPAGKEATECFLFELDPRIPIFSTGPNGERMVAGWTEAELIDIAKHRADWVHGTH